MATANEQQEQLAQFYEEMRSSSLPLWEVLSSLALPEPDSLVRAHHRWPYDEVRNYLLRAGALPFWKSLEIEPETDLVLFSFSDKAAQQALNLYREVLA